MNKEEKARDIIETHVLYAIGGGLIPVPIADFAAVTVIQLNMIEKLTEVYGISYSLSLGKKFISALGGTLAARLGSSMIKAIPGIGTVIGEAAMSITSAASTYALGKIAMDHFREKGDLKVFDTGKMKEAYNAAYEKGKEYAARLKEEMDIKKKEVKKSKESQESQDVEDVEDVKEEEPETREDILNALEKLADLREKNILSEKEFATQKEKLLNQL